MSNVGRDLELALHAGDGIEHEAREGDHQAHQDEAFVVGPVCVKHEPCRKQHFSFRMPSSWLPQTCTNYMKARRHRYLCRMHRLRSCYREEPAKWKTRELR